MVRSSILLVAASAATIVGAGVDPVEIVVYESGEPGAGEDFAPIAAALGELRVMWRPFQALGADRERVHLVLDAAALPLAKRRAIAQAIEAGGRWIFLGTPGFSDPAFPWEGRLAKRSEIEEAMRATKPTQVVASFAEGSGARAPWRRSTNTPDHESRHEFVETENGPALLPGRRGSRCRWLGATPRS